MLIDTTIPLTLNLLSVAGLSELLHIIPERKKEKHVKLEPLSYRSACNIEDE